MKSVPTSKTGLTALTISALLLAAPVTTLAHRAWILPAATVHSSEDAWVTVDAAISNDIFHTDFRPMRLDDMQILGPGGMNVEMQNGHTGHYRSTFDINLNERGTYKVFTASEGLMARWTDENGERRMWPGRGQRVNPEDFATEVPTDAEDLQVTQMSRRQETFVTSGVPSDDVLKATGEGFEMEPITHPNDLFEGETAQFRFLYDGEPVAGAEVEVLAGGMRYRNSQDEIMVTSGADGVVEITWPAPGMYWMEAVYQDDRAEAPASQRRGSYIATFEVLPF